MGRKPVYDEPTYAFFECDFARGEIGVEPPSGKGISDRLKERLHSLGFEFQGPMENCTYGWDLEYRLGTGSVIWNRIQFSGHTNDDQVWHTMLEVRRPLLRRFFKPPREEIEEISHVAAAYREAVESIGLKNIEWDETGLI